MIFHLIQEIGVDFKSEFVDVTKRYVIFFKIVK